jgi:hypothetical protein
MRKIVEKRGKKRTMTTHRTQNKNGKHKLKYVSIQFEQ